MPLLVGHDQPLSDADIIALGQAVKSDGFVAHQPNGGAIDLFGIFGLAPPSS